MKITLSFKRKHFLFYTFIIVALAACEIPEERTLPDHLENLENLSVFNSAEQEPDKVELEKVAVFESNGDIYMEGRLSNFTVDNQDRVYIAATQMGRLGIYVFNPDGDYITRIAQHGPGPGEYESISSIDIYNNQLYLKVTVLRKCII